MWRTESEQNMFADTFCKLDEIQNISHMKVTRNIPQYIFRELSVLSTTI